MKKKNFVLLFALAALLSAIVGSQPVLAAERTVELRTPGCV